MERKLNWKSGCFDEIELVYEKAEENEGIGNMLSAMEQAALTETRSCIHLLRDSGDPITAEQFDQMSDAEQEQIIEFLSRAGLAGLSAPPHRANNHNQAVCYVPPYYRLHHVLDP